MSDCTDLLLSGRLAGHTPFALLFHFPVSEREFVINWMGDSLDSLDLYSQTLAKILAI
jgi:hypothetical protein